VFLPELDNGSVTGSHGHTSSRPATLG